MFELVKTVHASELKDIYAFGPINSLSEGIGYLTGPAFQIAALGVVFYFFYGAYKMITAGTDKGALDQARQMITHSIIGFILLMMSYALVETLFVFLGLKNFSIF